jgi:hypothetical protein
MVDDQIPAALPCAGAIDVSPPLDIQTGPIQDAVAISAQSAAGAPRAVSSLIALLLSTTALLFSAITLHETVLKQARPAIYASSIMRYWRDREGSEAFALPLALANHGVRDAVVISLGLSVHKPGQTMQASFTSGYLGDGPEAALRLFAPVSIAGHNSFAGTVVFRRDGHDAALSRPQLVDAQDVYVFCVWIQTELNDEWGVLGSALRFRPLDLGFRAELPWFDRSALESGQPVSMPIGDVKRDAGCHV